MDNFTPKPIGNSSLDSGTRDRLASTPAEPAVPNPDVNEPVSFWRRNRWFVVLLGMAAAVIAVVGFFIMRSGAEPAEPNIGLELSVPEEVSSGGEAVVKAVVTNNDSKTMAASELELVYPSGVVFVSSNPASENLSGTLYKVPSLTPGTNVAILIKLRFEGGVGEERRLQARLKYSLSGITAQFTKEQKSSTRLVTAGASVDIQGPATSTNAQLVSYTLHYTNQSNQGFERARVKFSAPQGFQFAQANPAPSQGNDTWDIAGFSAGAQGDIAVSGSFNSSSPGQSMQFTAQLLVPDKDGNFYVQAQGEFTTAIATQPLLVTQTLGSADSEGVAVAKPGESLQYRIAYQNNATVAARGVRIIFTVDSTTADLSSLQAEGAQISGNTVTWSAASSQNLEVLNPNESGSLSVTLRLKDPPVQDRSVNPELVTNVKIKADEYDTFLPGNKVRVKIATVLRLEGSASFMDGQKPPRVGQETTYRVSVSLRNATSDITNGTLTLFIATGGQSFNKSSVTSAEEGVVSYDAATGKLTWRFGTLRAHTGDFAPPRTLQFTLKVVPSASGVGKPIRLVKDIHLTGQDNHVGKDVTADVSEITSQESGANSNEGIVVQ